MDLLLDWVAINKVFFFVGRTLIPVDMPSFLNDLYFVGQRQQGFFFFFGNG